MEVQGDIRVLHNREGDAISVTCFLVRPEVKRNKHNKKVKDLADDVVGHFNSCGEHTATL